VHAVGAFEDWIYSLFRQESTLDYRHNAKLFMLLSRTRRSQFVNNLSDVLAGGFSCDFEEDSQLPAEQFLFGGCYFAATGPGKDTQAFVKGVFTKVIEQHAELEWAPRALQSERKYLLAANFFALIGMVSLAAIAVMVYLMWQQT
jgi:hypothetical protein